MRSWELRFEGEWLESGDETVQALREHGYSLGAYRDVDDGRYIYILFRRENQKHVTVHMTKDRNELNNYVNLLLPPRVEG